MRREVKEVDKMAEGAELKSENWVMVVSEQHRYQGVSYKSDIIVISGNPLSQCPDSRVVRFRLLLPCPVRQPTLCQSGNLTSSSQPIHASRGT